MRSRQSSSVIVNTHTCRVLGHVGMSVCGCVLWVAIQLHMQVACRWHVRRAAGLTVQDFRAPNDQSNPCTSENPCTGERDTNLVNQSVREAHHHPLLPHYAAAFAVGADLHCNFYRQYGYPAHSWLRHPCVALVRMLRCRSMGAFDTAVTPAEASRPSCTIYHCRKLCF